MSRRRKPKTLLSVLLYLFLGTIKTLFDWAMSYKPYNSRGAKISRSKKKKWF